MWNKLVNWVQTYDVEICWFMQGMFVVMLLDSFAIGNWINALIDAVIIAANYAWRPKR